MLLSAISFINFSVVLIQKPNQCLNRGGTRVHAVPLLFVMGGKTYPYFFVMGVRRTPRNGFRDYIDNKGENVPEELKQVFRCADYLPVSTVDC